MTLKLKYLSLLFVSAGFSNGAVIWTENWEDSNTTGWGGIAAGNILDTVTYPVVGGPSTAGSEVHWLYGATGTFTSSSTFEANFSYDLTFDHFTRVDLTSYAPVSATVEIGYDNGGTFISLASTISTTDSSGTAITGTNITTGVIATGNAAIGEDIIIRMVGDTNPAQAGIDNLSLNAVPEPTSSALLGLATLGLIARRKRG